MLPHGGIGVWLAGGRFNVGRLVCPKYGGTMSLTPTQFDAPVLGLPWQRLGDGGGIRVL